MRMFEDLSNSELLKQYEAYDDLVNGVNACFGTKDVMILHELEREITLREESP